MAELRISHTNSYDEALGLPTEESATVALRTQQIIAEESGVANVVDPLGGSHLVEMLTEETYQKSLGKILEIENMGKHACYRGWISKQREIHETAWSHLTKVETGERLIVGINHGVSEDEEMPPLLKPDPELGRRQFDKLPVKLRLERDSNAVATALRATTDAAQGTENLFPLVIEALKKDCTLGETTNAMKEVSSAHMAPSGF